MAIALGLAATEAGYRTYFTSASDMVAALQSAHLEGATRYRMRIYSAPSVLVIDKLGYLPLDQASANWIFEVVSRRYGKGSILLTSNRGFSDWGQVFADSVVATAIVDRLLHSATVVNIRSRSYRMRAHQELLERKKRSMRRVAQKTGLYNGPGSPQWSSRELQGLGKGGGATVC